MRLAARTAAAAGALLGTVAQTPHSAAASGPRLPGDPDPNEPTTETLSMAAVPGREITLPVIRPGQQAPIAQAKPTAVSGPFGLQNLPPEVSGPLTQAERAIERLHEQVMPAAVRPVSGAISSGFGTRWGARHYGIDFADRIGTPIHAVAGGTVVQAGPAAGFGQWVRVRHDDGSTSVYGHVNSILAHPGQHVSSGDVIATVGNRGNSTGPHLHLEIWDPAGRKIDPVPWLLARGVAVGWGPGL